MNPTRKPRSSNAERQARFRAKQAGQNGFVQCCVWIPEAAMADMQLQAEILRKYPHLTVGPLRDPHTGKFVALREKRSAA
jgi:hypothetical protein